MNPTWNNSSADVRSACVVVISLLVLALAGCTPSSSPDASVLAPPTAVATSSISAMSSAPGEVNFFFNVGGGLVHQPGDYIDIIANKAEVNARLLEVAPDEGFVLTANAPIVCPGILKEPRIRLMTSEGLVATALIDPAGVATFDRTVPSFVQLVGDICNGATAEAKVTMSWDCDGVPVVDREIGRLLCGQVDVSGMDDPTGVIDGPLTNCPHLPGVQMTLMRVDGMTTAGPSCAAVKPGEGWQWSKSLPVMPATFTMAAAGSLQPEANPQSTDSSGVYGWIAPFNACYFVKAVHGACTWYSQVFFVAEGVPVTELDFRRIEPMQTCSFTTAPCP